MRSRATRLACLAAAVIIFVSAAPRFAETQQSARVTFIDLLHEYRRGDADRAVQILRTWTDGQIQREAKLPPGENDAWSKAAAALLLAEVQAGHMPATGNAENLIADAYDAARATGDQRLLVFCRSWYFVGLTTNMQSGTNMEAAVRKRFSDDPLAQLELGKRAEELMPNSPDSDHDGYVHGSGRLSDVVGTSSHGPYGQDAAKAERAFRRALTLDPALVEARVRLGRVLWFLDRRDEAARELAQAVREATAAGSGTAVYLASVFLGQVDEEQGNLDAAREAYEQGIRAYPGGQVARLALGRLLVATGHEADGWSMTESALDPKAWERRAPDPWRSYTLDGTWWFFGRLRDLRLQVRQS